ncbi:MAG: ion transporter [Alcanivorax sp.]|uniref:Ion transporter n=1 Tax=Alloalcanivorax marinus TaxID=1177169 RepID=A0A9Q3YMW6_9GAMM|nr:ion transporter [Alloalcanivorax marinus]MBM7333853.1 ion transporter [Alloalcanivorax marinus]MCC4309269.1 ion transporter [Alloalcanivorax marinus]MCU5786623.1 potassium channel protein [Alloalcanivorax marinus]
MNARSASLRDRWRHIIFGTDTPAGRWFDQLLILAIIASVLAVTLDSVQSIHQRHGTLLYAAEWFFTLLFTLEYIVRLWVSDRPLRYARSFYGVVDLVSVIPTYLSLLLPGANYLLTIRALRVLRVFRVLKLAQLMDEANQLGSTLVRTRRKIGVFMFAVVVVIIIFGSLMYVVEGPANGFTSIPRSIYWAIVTITTVGYGDISPQTPFGQAVASLAMITGYAIIAVPTGIVTAEMSRAHMAKRYERECPNCHRHDHDPDARFCKQCGTGLPRPGEPA